MQRCLAMAMAITAACGGDDGDDGADGTDGRLPPEPPPAVTGPVHRFVLDAIQLPMTGVEARDFGIDLDGDETPDNDAGVAMSVVHSLELATPQPQDPIGSGIIQTVVEIQADDLTTDDSVLVWYRRGDGGPAVPVFGALTDGVFTAAPSVRTRIPGRAVLDLPLVVDADPTVLDVRVLGLTLAPDATGYVLGLQGAALDFTTRLAAGTSFAQMLAARPGAHDFFVRFVDPDATGDLSPVSITSSRFVAQVLAPDLTLFDDEESSISFGIRAHIVPCPDGRCLPTAAPTCFDRVQNGAETDLDCGGDCLPCPGGAACVIAADCQENACDAGACRAPSCTDGVLNAYESDIDCGYGCPDCARGKMCLDDDDCASGACDATCQ